MIYCVEDDDNIRELVIYTLETTGLKARGFADGSAFTEALAFETPELILLDIMLPGEDGLEILKKLKCSSKTKSIPVIMVTAKGSEYDKVIGLIFQGGKIYVSTTTESGTYVSFPKSFSSKPMTLVVSPYDTTDDSPADKNYVTTTRNISSSSFYVRLWDTEKSEPRRGYASWFAVGY